MSRPTTDAEALIAILAEEARNGAGVEAEPEPEELLDYLAGRLSREEEERLDRQLVASPAAARALLDLDDLEAAGAAAGTQPPEVAIRASWRDLEGRLEAARRPHRTPPLLSVLAASLLIATIGLGFRVWHLQGELRRPVANVKTLELSVSRAGTEKVEKLAAHESLRLVVAPEDRCPSYTAEVTGPEPDDRQNIDLLPDGSGNLTFFWRRPEPGAYRLHLYGCEPRRELEDHRFRIDTDGG